MCDCVTSIDCCVVFKYYSVHDCGRVPPGINYSQTSYVFEEPFTLYIAKMQPALQEFQYIYE